MKSITTVSLDSMEIPEDGLTSYALWYTFYNTTCFQTFVCCQEANSHYKEGRVERTLEGTLRASL